MLKSLFQISPEKQVAHDLFLKISEQSRNPHLYLQGEVPDTVDGRFDALVFVAVPVLHHLKQSQNAGEHMAQLVFDAMFKTLDVTLREMGIGDLSVGKKIRKMAEAFYGRASAYKDAVESGEPERQLASALRRNLYRGAPVSDHAVAMMADYFRRQWSALEGDALLISTDNLTFVPVIPQREG